MSFGNHFSQFVQQLFRYTVYYSKIFQYSIKIQIITVSVKIHLGQSSVRLIEVGLG